MKYLITGKNYISDIFSEFKDSDVEVMSEEKFANSDIKLSYEDIVYAPDETTVEFVLKKLESEKRRIEIETMKDKYKFRQLLSNKYPDYYFDKVKLSQLKDYKVPEGKKFVAKPVKGFFSTAIKFFDENSGLGKIQSEMELEISERTKFFSKEVFSGEEILIEEEIEGIEEYAVDVFYDIWGEPVITNIGYHPIPESEYFFVLHYVNKEKFFSVYDKLIDIFKEFNKELGAKNLPFHAEFKLTKGGELIPIEFNVPRFGGFGFADIPYYTLGFNPFEKFFKSENVDWSEIWKGKINVGMVLCYFPEGCSKDEYAPDHEKMKSEIKGLKYYHKVDYMENPVFAVAFFSLESEGQTLDYLKLDFKEYISPKARVIC